MDGKWERIIIEYQCGLGYQLAPFMANSNDDLKKKSSLKKTESTNNTSSS